MTSFKKGSLTNFKNQNKSQLYNTRACFPPNLTGDLLIIVLKLLFSSESFLVLKDIEQRGKT